MACSISIDLNSAKLIQDSAGSPPSTIQINGTASECEKVTVYLVGQNPTAEVTAAVNAGAWQANFNAPSDFNPNDFPCGVVDVKITAYCTEDPTCREDTAIPVLNCVPRDCPSQATVIVYKDHDPADLVDLTTCLPPGVYTVQITDPVTPNTFYQWSLNGQTLPAASGNGQNSFEITLASNDPSQTISAIIMLSSTCLLSAAVTLQVCTLPDECAGEVLLQVSQNNVPVPDLTNCLAPGSYTIAVTGPTGPGISYGWSVDNILQPGENGSDFVFTLLPGENHAIQVSVAQPDCPPIPGSVTLTGCEAQSCADEVTWQVVDGHGQPADLNDECLPPGRYTVTVQDPIGPDVSYRWILNGTEQSAEHANVFSVDLEAGGSAEIGVIVQQAHCPEISARLKLTGCRRPDDRECPEEVSLVVRNSTNNPVDPDNCQQPGNYTVRVSQPAGAGLAYSWSINGQVQSGQTNNALPVTLTASNPVNVAVSVLPDGCPPIPGGVTLTPCRRPDDGGGLPPPPSWCPILLISGLAAFLLGLVLIWAGMCTGNIPLAISGGVLAVVGIGLLIAWAFLCGTRRGGCRIFARLLQLLSILTIILGIVSAIFGAIAAVCAVITSPGVITEIICALPGACGLGAVIDFVLSGFLTAVLFLIFVEVCTDLTSSNRD